MRVPGQYSDELASRTEARRRPKARRESERHELEEIQEGWAISVYEGESGVTCSSSLLDRQTESVAVTKNDDLGWKGGREVKELRGRKGDRWMGGWVDGLVGCGVDDLPSRNGRKSVASNKGRERVNGVRLRGSSGSRTVVQVGNAQQRVRPTSISQG